MTVFSIALEKGGVGKTTTSISLLVEFAWARMRKDWPQIKLALKKVEQSGDPDRVQVEQRVAQALRNIRQRELALLATRKPPKTVLGIDNDPQRNTTMGFGETIPKGSDEPTTYSVLLNSEYGIDYAVRQTTSGAWLLRSELDMSEAEDEIRVDRERRLKQALSEAEGYEGYEVTLQAIDRYKDGIIIDCPPNMGLLTKNAFAVSDYVLIPMQAHYFALEAMTHLQQTVDLIRKKINKKLEIGGIFLTQYDARTKLSDTIQARVRDQFGSLVFDTIIPTNVDLAEASLLGFSIQEYNHLSAGAIAYHALYQEIAQRFSL